LRNSSSNGNAIKTEGRGGWDETRDVRLGMYQGEGIDCGRDERPGLGSGDEDEGRKWRGKKI